VRSRAALIAVGSSVCGKLASSRTRSSRRVGSSAASRGVPPASAGTGRSSHCSSSSACARPALPAPRADRLGQSERLEVGSHGEQVVLQLDSAHPMSEDSAAKQRREVAPAVVRQRDEYLVVRLEDLVEEQFLRLGPEVESTP
jgi:hypothetical protein